MPKTDTPEPNRDLRGSMSNEKPSGYEAFRIHRALKMHFTSKSYDYTLYNGSTKNNCVADFYKLNTRYFYHKIEASKYNLFGFILSNLLVEPSMFIGDLATDKECERRYFSWLGRVESIQNTFKEDSQKIFPKREDTPKEEFNRMFDGSDGFPPIFAKLIDGTISIETMLILDAIFGLVARWRTINMSSQNPLWKDWETRLNKYKPFIKIEDKEVYRRILLNTLGK